MNMIAHSAYKRIAIKPGGRIDPASRLDRLLSSQETKIRASFDAAIATIIGQATLQEIEGAIEDGQTEELLAALAALSISAGIIADAANAAFVTSGQSTAAFLSGATTVDLSFNLADPATASIMTTERARLIRQFSEQQTLSTLRAAQIESASDRTLRAQAKAIRASIGLTVKQVEAVENYRRLLTEGSREALNRELRDRRFDPSVRRAASGGAPLSRREVNRMVSRYRERQLRHRSIVIAESQALRAVHQANDQMYDQAINLGVLEADQIKRKWVTRRDTKVRSSHVNLNGLVRKQGDTFPGAAGALRFPGDPRAPLEETVNCRCVLRTTIADG